MMSDTDKSPFVKSIFHPSDFSPASESAFAHALAIALIRKTELVIMHARSDERADWSKFPAVRKTFARWQVLEPGSRPADVFAAEAADLIVLATAGRQGVFDALRGSVTERVVRGAPCPVLAVPAR